MNPRFGARGRSSRDVSAILAAMLGLWGCSDTHSPTTPNHDAGGDFVSDDAATPDVDATTGTFVDDASVTDGATVDEDDASAADGGMRVDPPKGLTNPWIAFTQIDSGGFGQLAFVKADGKGFRIYGNNASETDPAWSPNGKKLAFAQYEQGIGNSLHVLDMDTGIDSQLSDDFIQLSRPRWSPDGKTLVIAGTTADVTVSALFSIDVSSGDVAQITEPVNGDGGHDFKQDGTLYFVRRLSATSYDVFKVAYTATPATDPVRVTTDSSIVGGVSVHADGTRILYARSVDLSSELIELTLANDEERTIGESGDAEPSSFIDSDKLVLSRATFDADSEIAVVDGDGKLIKRCTKNAVFDRAPAVSPIESEAVDVSKL